MRARLISDTTRRVTIIVLASVPRGAVVAALPTWTIPLRVAGWALVFLLVLGGRRGAQSWSARLRGGLDEFRQPVSRRFATTALLTVGIPVLIVLILAVIWRYV